VENLNQKERFGGLERHLPLAQGIIAILTGLITIAGAGYSIYRYLGPAQDKGRMEAVIQDGQSGGPIAGATVEILSAGKALVATLEADRNGRVRYQLKEGRYDVRVKREGFADVTREVQVTSGESVELTVRLNTSTPPVKGIENAMKKILGR
jgi:hypothetical protein